MWYVMSYILSADRQGGKSHVRDMMHSEAGEANNE
jgi:hypothetical protein